MTFTPSQVDAEQQRTTVLPTMYDLPSDYAEEPGLPDEFHGLQPQLLSRTLQLSAYAQDEIFSVLDMSLHYDPDHPQWYKRPDWFLAVGVPRLYKGNAARRSYVMWDEKVSPIVVVEFLSDGTESEDLGRFAKKPQPPSKAGKPPCKFEVYETIVKVQNYIVYDKETVQLRYFRLVNGQYQEQSIAATNPRLWIPELGIGLGVWMDQFQTLPQSWLRWCDGNGNFLLTDTEAEAVKAEVERQAKEAAQSKLQQAVQGMLNRGLSILEVAEMIGLSEDEVQQMH